MAHFDFPTVDLLKNMVEATKHPKRLGFDAKVKHIRDVRPWYKAMTSSEPVDFFPDEDSPSFADVRETGLYQDEFNENCLVAWKNILEYGDSTRAIVKIIIAKSALETNHDWFEVTFHAVGMDEPVCLFEGFLDEVWCFYRDLTMTPDLVFHICLEEELEQERALQKMKEEREAAELAALNKEMEEMMLLEREDFGGF